MKVTMRAIGIFPLLFLLLIMLAEPITSLTLVGTEKTHLLQEIRSGTVVTNDNYCPPVSRRNALFVGSTVATITTVGNLIFPSICIGATTSVGTSTSFASSSSSSTTNMLLAAAEQDQQKQEQQGVQAQELLQSLRSVPTFCLVNSEGAAYMLYKQGRSGTFAKGYAFTTFSGALAVLGDAKRTAEKEGYEQVWKDATVTTIPADIAIRLIFQPRERTSQKDGIKANSDISLVPGAQERDAAIQLDDKFQDQSKVPLFYFDGLRLKDGSIPLYFNPRDLLQEWKQQQQQQQNGNDMEKTATTLIPPRIQVVDLVNMFQYVLRGRGNEVPVLSSSSSSSSGGKIVFVPSTEAVEVANDLKRKGLVPYKTDRMII